MGQNTVNQRGTCLDRKLPSTFSDIIVVVSARSIVTDVQKLARVPNFTPSMTQPNLSHTCGMFLRGWLISVGIGGQISQ